MLTSSYNNSFLQEIYSQNSLPDILVSDNATIFTSTTEFKAFCKHNGIRQRFILPGHPNTNDQAERYVYIIKKKMKTTDGEGSLHLNYILHHSNIEPHHY